MIRKIKEVCTGPLTDSDKRTLRTAYQAFISLIAIVPLLLADLGAGQTAAGIVAAVTGATRLVNALEDRGLIPAWLKGDTEVIVEIVEEPHEPMPEQTDNTERPEDPEQDVSQDPAVVETETVVVVDTSQ